MGAGFGSAAALMVLVLIIVLVIRHQHQVSKRSAIVNIAGSSRGSAANRNSGADLNLPYIYQSPVEMDAKRAVNEIAGLPIHEMNGSSVVLKAKPIHRTTEEESQVRHSEEGILKPRG